MPALHDWRRNAALTFAVAPFSLWSERTYQAMPRLDPAEPSGPLPMLSIVVPARNEAHNLVHLLPSLQHLCYNGPMEIIVVDDNSSDGTAQVAKAYGATVLRLDLLPEGWRGKPNACHRGAQLARGQWLLFTDADTVHAPDSALRAVSHAMTHHLDGLSLFLKQECRGWLDQLALAAAHAGLFSGAQPQNRLFNGQYILLRRDVYDAAGGFASVRGEALEDLALGARLRRQGFRVPVMLGEEAASVRMYENTAELWHGMERLGADSLRWSGPRSLWTALFVTALMSPLVTLIGVLLGGLDRRWLPATWAAASLPMIPWTRRFGNTYAAAAIPLGALFVQAAAVAGILNRVFGRGLKWKGRRV